MAVAFIHHDASCSVALIVAADTLPCTSDLPKVCHRHYALGRFWTIAVDAKEAKDQPVLAVWFLKRTLLEVTGAANPQTGAKDCWWIEGVVAT